MKNIILVIGIIALAGLGYLAAQYEPGLGNKELLKAEYIGEAKGCDLSESRCSVAGHSLEFIERPVLPLKPIRVELRSKTVIQSVILELEMQDMDMGINRFSLNKESQGLWSGTIMIPVCATGRRDWLVNMVIATPEGSKRAVYSFVVQ
jgi:hypothetical protein